MSDKIYVANGKTKTFDNGGYIVKFALNLRDLKKAEKYVYELNGVKYINLELGKKMVSPDQYGKTHYVSVDTFIPEPKNKSNTQERPVGDEGKDADELNDIPF
jgi:hypothetical protein